MARIASHHRLPLCLCHFVLTQIESLRSRHLVPRAFVIISPRLRTYREHARFDVYEFHLTAGSRLRLRAGARARNGGPCRCSNPTRTYEMNLSLTICYRVILSIPFCARSATASFGNLSITSLSISKALGLSFLLI